MRIIADGQTLSSDDKFLEQVKEKSGQPIELCYQCQKCASGCPMEEFFEFTPNQVIRMIHFGLKDKLLSSSAIWLCSGCETCGVRCPNGIKISEIMDALRAMSSAAKMTKEKQTETFHRLFLGEVKARGRVHETMLMAKFKLKSGNLFADMGLGLELFKRGKLPILPHSIKGKKHVADIFSKAEKYREGGR